MKKPSIEDVLALTKTLIHEYCAGKYENWFAHLSAKSVFICTGEGMIVGAKNIQERLGIYAKKKRGKIYREEYSFIPINAKTAVVFAEVTTGLSEKDFRILNYYTFIYQLIGGEPKIIYEHTSYEYFDEKKPMKEQSLSMDLYTFQFVKHLLLDNPRQERLCVTSGNQTWFLDMNTLLYVKGDGHGTQLYCIDKTVSCTKSMQELKKDLSEDFYQIHRSYLINTRYLTSLYCYEAELISGVKIPIPAVNYGKVKKELEEKLERPLRKTK